MISLDNLTVSYGGWTLFDNISLLINPKDRIVKRAEREGLYPALQIASIWLDRNN